MSSVSSTAPAWPPYILDNNGYLKGTIEEIAEKFNIDKAKIREILSLIQTFDPVGVAARDLKECLLIQLKSQGREESLCYDVVNICLDELEKKDYSKISKKLSVNSEEITKAVRQINALEPKPGRTYSTEKIIWSILSCGDAIMGHKIGGMPWLITQSNRAT